MRKKAQNVHYDAEFFAQCVTVTHTFLYIPATAEEELKEFYFIAFGARMPIKQTTKNVIGVPLSGNSII